MEGIYQVSNVDILCQFPGAFLRTVAFPVHKIPESIPSDSGIKDFMDNILIMVLNM